MDQDLMSQRLAEYFREQSDQPFGDAQLASGRTLLPFSRSLLTAADNLLTKADRALAAGDRERAERLVRRAAALDYDQHERTAPAAYVASLILFTAVTEALEDSAEGDPRWIDAAVETLASAEDWGRSQLSHALQVVRQDYHLEPVEGRTIDTATSQVPACEELRDAELGGEELAAAVMSVLLTVQDYRARLVRPAR